MYGVYRNVIHEVFRQASDNKQATKHDVFVFVFFFEDARIKPPLKPAKKIKFYYFQSLQRIILLKM